MPAFHSSCSGEECLLIDRPRAPVPGAGSLISMLLVVQQSWLTCSLDLEGFVPCQMQDVSINTGCALNLQNWYHRDDGEKQLRFVVVSALHTGGIAG